ncbi:MAG: dual specificity protein phosphatase family protein [Phycisphaerae bacterium]|jgi:hypothetical protein
MTHEKISPRQERWNRRITYGIVIAVLAVGLAVILPWLSHWPVHHFEIVQSGVLYRGSQPDAEALEYIISRYKIRTVVNLRGASSQKDWWQVERGVCQKYGVRMVDVSLSNFQAAVWGLKQFLAVTADAANHPIYVHCEAGSARTGYVIAAYRIAVQGWSYDQAIKEAEEFRFNLHVSLNREYDRILRELAAGADWHTLSGGVTSEPTSAEADANE